MRVTQRQEFQYLPIQCPKCRLQGKIKIGRLDRTFTCKKCNSDFYVAPDGVLLGERPADALDNPYLAGVPQRQSRLIQWLERLPRASWLAIGGAVAVIAALSGAWLILRPPGISIPESLDDRARFVAEGLVRGDLDRIIAVAADDTRYEAEQWFRASRLNAWSKMTAESPVEVELETLYKLSGSNSSSSSAAGDLNDRLGEAGIVAHIRTAAAEESIPRMLYWVQNAKLEWHFDGKRTLREGQ